MIERFTKDEFENAIEEICEKLNLWHLNPAYLDGEWCWSIPLDKKVFINIRSTIGSDFYAKDTGEDSIRVTLHGYSQPGGLGKNSARWITRVTGWDKRLFETIKKLQEYRTKSGDCPNCNMPLHIYKVKKQGVNHGRMFATCDNKICLKRPKPFIWLT